MCMCNAYCLNTDTNRRLRQHCQYGGQHVVRTDKSFGPQVQCGREQNMNFICGPFRTIVIVTIGARALVRRSLISDHTNAGGSGGDDHWHQVVCVCVCFIKSHVSCTCRTRSCAIHDGTHTHDHSGCPNDVRLSSARRRLGPITIHTIIASNTIGS